MYAPALQGFGGIKYLCLAPKRQWDYREKKLGINFRSVIVIAVAGPTAVGGLGEVVVGEQERNVPSRPLPSHGCNGWRKRIFCHLQTIFHLGRAAA